MGGVSEIPAKFLSALLLGITDIVERDVPMLDLLSAKCSSISSRTRA